MCSEHVEGVCANFSEGCCEEGSEAGEIDFYIAAATTKQASTQFETLQVEKASWAVFSLVGDWTEIYELWGQIYREWFPTSGYGHAGGPEILRESTDKNEIWIPVVSK